MWKVIRGFVVILCICSCGCGSKPSPDEQFKVIVDEKKAVLREWLSANKPDLDRAVKQTFGALGPIDVRGEITEEKDVNVRLDHIYVGTLVIEYPIAMPKGEMCDVNRVKATYWYSLKESKWTYRGIGPVEESDGIGEKLITRDEIVKAFEKK